LVEGLSELPGPNEPARVCENPIARVRLSRYRSFRNADQMTAVARPRRSSGEPPVLEPSQEKPNCDTQDSEHRV